jgi:hypothetical protein
MLAGMEADNLCHWLALELRATETALLDPASKYCFHQSEPFQAHIFIDFSLAVLLQQKLMWLWFLEKQWANIFVSALHFQSAMENASRAAREASNPSGQPPFHWIQPMMALTIRVCHGYR